MASNPLPDWLDRALPTPEAILDRIKLLVPEQLDPNGWVRRLVTARIVFVMLYGYAIEGTGVWIRPTAVTDMTSKRARKLLPKGRREWLRLVQSPRRPKVVPGRWYGENSREQIRDESLRRLVELGIVVLRGGVAPTSPKPRYALATSVLPALAPGASSAALEQETTVWRQKHLSKGALARIALEQKSATASTERVRILLPNGETRLLAPGPSSVLTKAVVEEFAPRFLARPAVLLVSESATKISYQDKQLLEAVRLVVEAATTLPDVVMMDVDADPPLLIFVECVHTAGVVDDSRRAMLEGIALASEFEAANVAYVTAFLDRATSPFRANAPALAWGSFAWFTSEPDELVFFRRSAPKARVTLASLMRVKASP